MTDYGELLKRADLVLEDLDTGGSAIGVIRDLSDAIRALEEARVWVLNQIPDHITTAYGDGYCEALNVVSTQIKLTITAAEATPQRGGADE
jgi:hypothetical protein